MRLLALILAFLAAFPALAQTREGPLRIEINRGVIEPLPFAIAPFVAENAGAEQWAEQITRVVAADLSGTGLFREIDRGAFISSVSDFNAPVRYADWKAINAEALVTGAVRVDGNRVTVKFRLYDRSEE